MEVHIPITKGRILPSQVKAIQSITQKRAKEGWNIYTRNNIARGRDLVGKLNPEFTRLLVNQTTILPEPFGQKLARKLTNVFRDLRYQTIIPYAPAAALKAARQQFDDVEDIRIKGFH
jgi:hypothetical protein